MQPHQRQVFSISVVVEGLMSATKESLDDEALSVRVARQEPDGMVVEARDDGLSGSGTDG